MRRLLSALLLLTPALHADEETAPRKKLSAISMLPDGSKLQGVMFPRYDEKHRLDTVLKVRDMTLVNEDTVSGQNVTIEFFNDDQSPRGRIDMARATFHQDAGLLIADQPVTIRSDRLQAHGAGLTFVQPKNRGFLIGPCITSIQPPPSETSMNTRTASSAALMGVSLLTTPLTAAPPPAVGAEELARIQADAASRAPAAAQATTTVKADLAKATADAAAASRSAGEFIKETNTTPAAATSTEPPDKPLEIAPGPADTLIQCDSGMYFDAAEGILVYMGNVRVTDPRFSLTGAKELKIFLTKKAEDPKDGKKDDAGIQAKFGDVDRIVATGAVRVLQKAPEQGKEPVQASGAILTYKPKSGEMILSGGYPWVQQGTTFLRAKQPNLNLRILKDGSFVTEGNWDMGGKLPDK